MMDNATPTGLARSELNRVEAEKTYLEVNAGEQSTNIRHILTRPMTFFQVGDMVMFWRKWLGTKKGDIEGRWRGPGRYEMF